MREDYYDIDAILAQDEVVPCIFNTDACKLGFLDNTAEGVRIDCLAHDLLVRDAVMTLFNNGMDLIG